MMSIGSQRASPNSDEKHVTLNNDENNVSSSNDLNNDEKNISTSNDLNNDENNVPSSNDLNNNENISPEKSTEHEEDNQLNSPTVDDINHSNSRISSPKITRSQSHSSISSQRQQSFDNKNENIIQRPPSPVTRHRVVKQQNRTLNNKQRNRSNSPRKTFSYLPPDRLNVRKWKEHHREIAKQEEEDRIYYENRQKLERLAKIAKEPSSYPSIHLEQERLRERHTMDYRRKILKSYIPLFRDNLCIVDRLANVKGVYDIKKMNEDFSRHTQILKQDAANRKKARETAAQRPFILPKINLKS